ncbi:hypothetical protein KKG45_10055 [bacterium]|nr:hypothetical protein [bacterium]MBU1073578.1 hypothetical protein [bacterium]MBU1674576.1 hypothetical protein [bacterium]
MDSCHRRTFSASLLVILLAAAHVSAYEILLDIDTDFDPTTIDDLTYETSALVKLILAPSTPGELIGRVEFGLGGSCLECDLVHEYGSAHDLVDSGEQLWVQASAFASGWDYALSLGCPDDPGYHLHLWFEPLGGGTISVNQAFFLAEFNAWVANPVPPGCRQPASNLAAMPQQGAYWNYIQLGGPAVAGETRDWGEIKSLYR